MAAEDFDFEFDVDDNSDYDMWRDLSFPEKPRHSPQHLHHDTPTIDTRSPQERRLSFVKSRISELKNTDNEKKHSSYDKALLDKFENEKMSLEDNMH